LAVPNKFPGIGDTVRLGSAVGLRCCSDRSKRYLFRNAGGYKWVGLGNPIDLGMQSVWVRNRFWGVATNQAFKSLWGAHSVAKRPEQVRPHGAKRK